MIYFKVKKNNLKLNIMNVIIDNISERVTFDVTGSEENILTIEGYLLTLYNLGVRTKRIGRISGTENYATEISCIKKNYNEVFALLKNFISKS